MYGGSEAEDKRGQDRSFAVFCSCVPEFGPLLPAISMRLLGDWTTFLGRPMIMCLLASDGSPSPSHACMGEEPIHTSSGAE